MAEINWDCKINFPYPKIEKSKNQNAGLPKWYPQPANIFNRGHRVVDPYTAANSDEVEYPEGDIDHLLPRVSRLHSTDLADESNYESM